MGVQRDPSEPSPITSGPPPPGRTAPDRPLLGRQRELRLLARVFRDARDGRGSALVLHGEAVPNRLLMGLAMLGLLSDAGQEQTLICVVDDAHWLDKASADALAFVARRLESERVAIVFAMRESSERPELATLPQLPVRGLTDEDARRLLASEILGPIDQRVEDRIIAEARGNPLALIELSRGNALGMDGGYAILDLGGTAGRAPGAVLRAAGGVAAG